MAKNTLESLSARLRPRQNMDDFFSSQEERDDAKRERIHSINTDLIDDFPDHPFLVLMDDEFEDLVNSIAEDGQIEPAIVRPVPGSDRYQMVSGHRRLAALRRLGKKEILAVIRDLDDDDAIKQMAIPNLKRRQLIRPSEKAKAYKMLLDATNHQGFRTDLTSGNNFQKLDEDARDRVLEEETGVSARQIRNIARLTNLVPELLDLVDDGKIKTTPAIDISYLSPKTQMSLVKAIDENQAFPSVAQTKKLRQMAEEAKKDLSVAAVNELLKESKPNQIEKIPVRLDRIRELLPEDGLSNKAIEDYIVEALGYYKNR